MAIDLQDLSIGGTEVELDEESDATLSTGHIHPQDFALFGAGNLSAYWEDQS